MRRALPAVAVGLTLLAVWPPAQSAFHEPKRWVFVVAAALGAVITLPKWRWTALPLIALTALQPWRSAEAGLQAMAFAWALAAWEADVRWLTRVAGACGAIVGVVVVLQAVGVDVLGFAGPEAGGRLRVYGTLGNPDFVASMLLPIAVLLLGATGSTNSTGALSPAGERAVQLLLITSALVLTRSFATLLSALIAVAVLCAHRWKALSPHLFPPLFHRPQGPGPSGRGSHWKQLIPVILVCGLLTIGLVGRDLGQAIAGRRYLVSVALPAVADAPLLGHGLGATVQAWPTWELSYWQARCPDAACVAADPQRPFAAHQDHVHSDFPEWLLERGVLGLLALLLALSTPLRAAWKRSDGLLFAAMAAVLARALVDFPLHRPADLCLLAALAACAQVSPASPSPSPTP